MIPGGANTSFGLAGVGTTATTALIGMTHQSSLRQSTLLSPSPIAVILKREIKFGGLNCPLEPSIAMELLLCDMSAFRKYLCLSPQWHRLVIEAMDEYFKDVEKKFVNQNYQYLLFKKSYTNSSII